MGHSHRSSEGFDRLSCVGCWCLGLANTCVSRMFPKFVFGSFVESFGISPSGELLGLGEGGTHFSHQNGVGLWAQRDIGTR
jgi:hypothetical protein